MTEQETDSNLTSALPSDLVVPHEPKAVDETASDDIYDQYSPVLGKSDILGEGWSTLRQIDNPQLAERSVKLLTTIQNLLVQFQQRGFDLVNMSRLHARLPEDGSVLLEWILNDYRIGFTLEQNTEESGWYVVSNRRMGEHMASGALTQVDPKMLANWLKFVLDHS